MNWIVWNTFKSILLILLECKFGGFFFVLKGLETSSVIRLLRSNSQSAMNVFHLTYVYQPDKKFPFALLLLEI